MRYPINGTIFVTEPFGTRGTVWTFGRHMGVDLRANFIALYAPDNGVITERYVGSQGIQVLSMRIGNQEHRFLHLSAMTVNVGDRVTAGQRIGTTGNSGGVAAHLHWDVRTAGTAWNASFDNYVDPMTLVNNKGEDMIRDVDNEFGRWNKLGRQIRGRNLTRNEFRKSAVGLSWLRAMEILSDNPESDLNASNAELGRRARAGNWESQIKSLNDAIKIKDNEITRLQAELALISNDTENLNKFGEMLRWFVSRIGLNK